MAHDLPMGYEVTTRDGSSEIVGAAGTYRQEGPLTTFFATDPDRQVIDSWSVRLASFRTADIVRVRMVDDRAAWARPLAG
jgi:hypothetical protein